MKISQEDKAKWLALLRDVKFFAKLEKEDLARILDAGSVHYYKLHDYIFKQEDTDSSFFVILKGAVKVIKHGPNRQKKEVGRLESGACFGEIGLLLNESRTASVLASCECFIFRLEEADIRSMPNTTQAKIYRKFAEDLAGKLMATTAEMLHPSP